MVIAHILNDDGGVGRVAETLCNAQIADGHYVYVFTSNGKQKFLANLDSNVEVIKIERNPKIPQILDGLHIRWIYRYLADRHTDTPIILHAHNLVSVGLFAKLGGVPLLCTIHGLSKFPNAKETLRSRLQTLALRIIIRKIVRAGGKVYGVSNHTSHYYNAVSGMPIETIYNGTPEKELTCAPASEYFYVAHVGDISRAKGWDCTLAACAILKQRMPKKNIRYISAGRLCDIDENEISRLTSISALAPDNIHYLGFVRDTDALYKNAQVLVLASDSEGLPMTILEAQSIGVPVIVTAVGGCPEAIVHGTNGFIVNKDPNEIAEQLETLISSPDTWLTFSTNAKQIHKENFSARVMIDKYYKSYETIGVRNGNR